VLKRIRVCLLMLFISAFFSACDETETIKPLKGATDQQAAAATTQSTAPTVVPTPTFPPYPHEDLDAINQQMPKVWEELRQKYTIAVMESGAGQDHIMMRIRKYGDFEKPFSSDELKRIRKAIFAVVGKEFPLKLDTFVISPDGYMSGEIKQIEQERALIVNKLIKNGNSQDPQATWVGMENDGKIIREGSPEVLAFDKLAVGQQVHFWTSGLMLDSYPGQTSACGI
jgi:hypothetical protein